MAHTKAGGKARQKSHRAGKRLGVKMFAGEIIKTGQIITRQLGTKIHAGEGVGMGRDFTLFATKDGKLNFKRKLGKQVVEIK